MTDRDSADGRIAPTKDAERWLTIHDDVLRGLTHALSNRVGTIFVVTGLVEATSGDRSSALHTLVEEAERLEALLKTMRQLPRRTEVQAEPMIPADAAHAAIELHTHNADARNSSFAVQTVGDVAPASTDPAMLTLALVAALSGAQRLTPDVTDTTRTVEIVISSTADIVTFDVCVHDPSAGDADHAAARANDIARDAGAAAFLLGDGGDVFVHAKGITIHVPSLAAARALRHRR